MRNRLLVTIGILLALTLLIASCGDDDDTDAAAPSSSGPTETTTGQGAASSSTENTTVDSSTSTTTTTPAAPTITDLLAVETPLNIAHAGGDQDAPHSTMFAFSEAIAAGADMLELDVQLSGDGVLIVQHDDTVDKTTNETGPVANRTVEELQALDNAYWFSPECWPCQDRPTEEYIYRGVRTGDVEPPEGYSPEDFTVVTFRELSEAFPSMPLDIEIKGEFPDAVPVAEALAAELSELGRVDSSIVVSFDTEVLDAFKELAPDVATSPGVDEMTAWVLAGQPLGDHPVVQVPPYFDSIELVNATFMDTAEAAGVDVWVWPDDASTQENELFYREMIDLGVHGVIAGRPAEMTAAVSE